MSESSKIQWCDGTVNPTMGCDGCELWQAASKADARRSCYAGILTERKGGTNSGFPRRFEAVTRYAGRMRAAAAKSDLRGRRREDKPWLDGMPRLWFVSDMSDALSDGISFEYLRTEIIDVVRSEAGRRHCWLWLTKRPKRMAEFSRSLGTWPRNLWAGMSITSTSYLNRISYLREVGDDSTIRFLSIEPQHEPISVLGQLDGISWVIQGGESGPKAGTDEILRLRGARPFDLEWARTVRDECRRAGVPYFLKQLGSMPMDVGKSVKLKDGHAGDWNEWPTDLRVREVPR